MSLGLGYNMNIHHFTTSNSNSVDLKIRYMLNIINRIIRISHHPKNIRSDNQLNKFLDFEYSKDTNL